MLFDCLLLFRTVNSFQGLHLGLLQGCKYIPLLHTPLTNDSKRPGDVHTISSPPKGVYTPCQVGWKPRKPRAMNKGYVLPPLELPEFGPMGMYSEAHSFHCPRPGLAVPKLRTCSLHGVFQDPPQTKKKVVLLLGSL